VVKRLLTEMKGKINGMVHCSGGAQTKVLHFVDDLHVIKDNMFAVPPLFKLIHEQSGTAWEEMYRVFNMGHRMEIYLSEGDAQQVIDIANSFNIDAQIVGRCEANEGNKLTIRSEFGEFIYDK
jgi:phosphoribosylformylglycinamidine cyclo-ligase